MIGEFAATVSEALRPGSMSVEDLRRGGSSPVAQEERRTEDKLAALYREAVASGDAGLRRETVRATAEIRQELKAIYGEYDNYPPWSYERLYGNTKSVVAVGVAGRLQPICSGVLVADNLVLTAGHCLKESLPTDLEVWFNFVETADGSPEPVRFAVEELVAPDQDRHEAFLERAEREAFDRSLMDFALLRFDRVPSAALPDGVAPQCLRKPTINRGTPLYVVGYPKGARATVHDNGRVYLPFNVRKTQLEDLRREIEVDFAGLADAERLAILDQFTTSYEPDTSGGSTVFRLFDPRYGGQPKIGIIADTFRGNSGSPVYDRDGQQCVIGILIGGAPDTGVRLPASWQQHESVLPISAIRDDLLAHPATATLVNDGTLNFR